MARLSSSNRRFASETLHFVATNVVIFPPTPSATPAPATAAPEIHKENPAPRVKNPEVKSPRILAPQRNFVLCLTLPSLLPGWHGPVLSHFAVRKHQKCVPTAYLQNHYSGISLTRTR